MKINFMSSKDTDKERVMHSKSGNLEIITNYKVNQIIGKLLDSLLSRCQRSWEESMKGIH